METGVEQYRRRTAGTDGSPIAPVSAVFDTLRTVVGSVLNAVLAGLVGARPEQVPDA